MFEIKAQNIKDTFYIITEATDSLVNAEFIDVLSPFIIGKISTRLFVLVELFVIQSAICHNLLP